MNKVELFKRLSIFALILLLLCGGWLLFKKPSTISRTFFTADTVCSITLYDGSEELLDSAVELTGSLANKLNCYLESSELSKLNKDKIIKFPSDELKEAVELGLYYSALKDGVFDITIKPVSQLWDFKNGTMPNSADVTDALKKVNYKSIEITDNQITLKDGAEIDLGAVAKGYIAKKVSDFLLKNGVKSAIINLGGNVTVLGDNNGDAFNVGIQKPFGEGSLATVKVKDFSVVTSGTYQRCFKKDGTLYHHLLNTKTGMPQNTDLASVTVITKSAGDADPMSTLCFLLGADDGMALIEHTDGFEAVFIDNNGNIKLSSGLVKNFENIISLK
ncbi:MAG: FAD:protein FMN transferase [Clostridia bacterium]|nr:FAD:protein FMN transferase [Clostridia bacterium]